MQIKRLTPTRLQNYAAWMNTTKSTCEIAESRVARESHDVVVVDVTPGLELVLSHQLHELRNRLVGRQQFVVQLHVCN